MVKRSSHHGVGGFTKEFVPKGTLFYVAYEPVGWRGFNYSNKPNSAQTDYKVPESWIGGERVNDMTADVALRDIQPGEEITFPYYDGNPRLTEKRIRKALDDAGFYTIPTPQLERKIREVFEQNKTPYPF